MSKKANKNQPEKKTSDIVDQQKDPMLRALQKKTRNINKKLTQIAQLSLKKDLKPQQEQKISKKPQLVQQREKYQEMINIYQQIAAENEKIIRRAQLLQLQDLASIIAFKEYGVDLGFHLNQNVDNLVKVLTTSSSNELTLQGRIKQISSALTDVANNSKLKKNVKEFIQKNNDYKKITVNSQCLSNQPEPISPRSEKERQEELKQLQQQQKKHETQNNQPLTPQISQMLVHQYSQKLKVKQQQVENIQKTKSQNNQNNVLPKVQQIDEKNLLAESQQQNKNQNRGNTQKGEVRRERRERGERGGRGQRRDKDTQREYGQRTYNKKRNFKPKYEQKQKEERRNDDDDQSSSLSPEPQPRQFKRQQVRELIQDGFIVVGKPKVKARDQKQYYDHQHGNKYHKHHSKKNY